MTHHTRFLLSAAALAAICAAAIGTPARAQVPPPTASPAASAPPNEPGAAASTAPSTTAPAETMAPAPSPAATTKPKPSSNPGQQKGKIKKLKEGTLSYSQVTYAISHPLQEAKQLGKLHTVNFNNIRVVRLSKLGIKGLHAMNLELTIADESFGTPVQVAQTTPNLPTTNGNNSPIQYLRDVLANINVSNALNNLLNNSNVNVNVSLSDVLNNNKIAIGQVVGVYVGGGGLINTIVK